MCFLYLEEKKTCRKILGTEQNSENVVSSRFDGVLGAFYSLGTNFEVAAFSFKRPPPIGLILTPLERSCLPVFEKVMDPENPIIGSKVMGLGS